MTRDQLLVAIAIAAAAPALAQDAPAVEGVLDATFTGTGPRAFDATFTHTAVDLAVVPTGDGREVAIFQSNQVVTGTVPGLFDRMAARCVGMATRDEERFGYALTGTCVMQDADGDMIFERIEEAATPGSVPAPGKGTITGGTGKFARITGEYEYESTSFAAMRGGMYQGVGRKTGTWRMAAR